MLETVVFTLYPEMFPGPLAHSVTGRALGDGLWSLTPVDIRGYAADKYGTVDDAPYGGGAGMVMKPDVVDRALYDKARGRLVYPTPRGVPLTQLMAKELSQEPALSVLCGHFEGIDERVIQHWRPFEISVGDYVLSGGEIAAFVIIDSVVRLLPGALGAEESLHEESFNAGLLEYFHYTRPRVWNGRGVPDVLVGGDHAAVARHRQMESERLTRERRPDLWRARINQDQKDKE